MTSLFLHILTFENTFSISYVFIMHLNIQLDYFHIVCIQCDICRTIIMGMCRQYEPPHCPIAECLLDLLLARLPDVLSHEITKKQNKTKTLWIPCPEKEEKIGLLASLIAHNYIFLNMLISSHCSAVERHKNVQHVHSSFQKPHRFFWELHTVSKRTALLQSKAFLHGCDEGFIKPVDWES